MHSAIRLVGVVLVLAPTWFPAILFSGEPSNLDEPWKRLARLEQGMDSAQVLSILGKPDEVRHVLEGGQLVGGRGPNAPRETERWAYGVLSPGMFATIGYVGMDRKGKVVGAVPADRLCRPANALLRRIPGPTDQAVATSDKLSCRVGPVEFSAADDSFKTTISLENGGSREFRLTHYAAFAINPFLIVEVLDSKKTVLWRVYEMAYHRPPIPPGDEDIPHHWKDHTLSVPPGKSKSETLYFNPSSGFGRLPPGNYFLRGYFPFEKETFYPSNLMAFQVPADQEQEPKADPPNGVPLGRK